MNERGAPLALGLAGLCVGVVAALTSGVLSAVLAVLAGACAIVAGLLALQVVRSVDQRHEVDLEVARAEHEARVREAESRLAEAWDHVRELEAAATATPASAEPASATDPSTLTDPDSQLFSEAYFRVALDARIASARRHLRPVAIALLEAFEGMAGPSASPAAPDRAAESIRQTVRDADTACRLGDGVYAIILEDTPENGAVWTVERVRRNLVSRYGSHTMWAGVACYPAHAFSSDELLDQARAALESAREWKQDRIEVAISD